MPLYSRIIFCFSTLKNPCVRGDLHSVTPSTKYRAHNFQVDRIDSSNCSINTLCYDTSGSYYISLDMSSLYILLASTVFSNVSTVLLSMRRFLSVKLLIIFILPTLFLYLINTCLSNCASDLLLYKFFTFDYPRFL